MGFFGVTHDLQSTFSNVKRVKAPGLNVELDDKFPGKCNNNTVQRLCPRVAEGKKGVFLSCVILKHASTASTSMLSSARVQPSLPMVRETHGREYTLAAASGQALPSASEPLRWAGFEFILVSSY